jgi:ArsR family transcriptional regulator
MLAEPTRLNLLFQLTEGPKTVTNLTAAAGVPRTVVSQHLAKLRLSGLVDTRKDGRHVIYSLHDGHLIRLIRETINHADHQLTGEPAHD